MVCTKIDRFYDDNMLPPIEYLEDSDRERIVGNDVNKHPSRLRL